MAILTCGGTGSSGNSYALKCGDEILILDVGISLSGIKKMVDFNLVNVVGCLVTHCHKDHSASANTLEKMGLKVIKPYEKFDSVLKLGGFTVKPFDLTDSTGKFMHTNGDGTECPCYGFLIEHKDLGRMLYITDTELVKYRFKNINHILISCNYQKKYITDNNYAKFYHVLHGHMELDTVKAFISANNSDSLKNVILCHISNDNALGKEIINEVNKIDSSLSVDVSVAMCDYELSV